MYTIPDKTSKPRGATSFYKFSQNDDEQNRQSATPAPTPTANDNNKVMGASTSANNNQNGGTPVSQSAISGTASTPDTRVSGGTLTKTTTTTTSNSPSSQYGGNSYDDAINFIKKRMEEYKPETPEERQKREKHERNTMLLAGIADVLGNMHKAYSYQRGVKPMDIPDATAKTRERIEKAKAERDKAPDRYLDLLIKLGDNKVKQANELRKEEKQFWTAALQGDKERAQKSKADEAESKAATAKAVADNAPEYQKAKVKTEEARRKKYSTSTTASGSSKPKEFYAWDEHGQMYSFTTKAAADRFAQQHGTWQKGTTTETTEGGLNGKQTKTKESGYPAKPSRGKMPGVK